jgi:predicted Ser/Thr protein kinase
LPPCARRVEEGASAAVWSDEEQPSDAICPELYDFLSPPQAADEMGRLGAYRVLKVLGAGGMGVVFQAEDPKLNRLVALKAMLPALAASGSNKERFLREARAAAAIEHDHVIPIFQVDEDRGVPFIAMPFLRGEPLEDRLKKQRKLPLDEALRIARETAEGLTAAHESNVIHRDIKPANVWLEGEKGRVKILDFGLARSASGESNLTQQGAIIGTPAYVSPEQANGGKVDCRCDLFSLGVVLYRMVTGTPPFKGRDTVSTLIAVSTAQPRPPHQLNPSVPPSLSRFILQLLAKNPVDRPPSARKVVSILEGIASEPAISSAAARHLTDEEDNERSDPTLAAVSVVEESPQRREHGPARKAAPIWPWFAAGAGVGGVILVTLLLLLLLFKPSPPSTSRAPEMVHSTKAPEGNEGKKAPGLPLNSPKQPEVAAGDLDRAVAEWAISIGGTVGVKPDDGKPIYSTNHVPSLPKGPFQLQQIFFLNNRRVTDDDMKRLNGLKHLDWLMLTGTTISDAGLEHLRDLPKLRRVDPRQTRVSAAGVKRLRAAFPGLNVSTRR